MLQATADASSKILIITGTPVLRHDTGPQHNRKHLGHHSCTDAPWDCFGASSRGHLPDICSYQLFSYQGATVSLAVATGQSSLEAFVEGQPIPAVQELTASHSYVCRPPLGTASHQPNLSRYVSVP